MEIKGTVRYQELETGFWGIIGHDGKKYRPVNMPASLKKEGLEVSVFAERAREGVSAIMWGIAVEIK